jgi:hypothetical protein
MFDLERTKGYLLDICNDSKDMPPEKIVTWWYRRKIDVNLDEEGLKNFNNAVGEIRKNNSIVANFDIKSVEEQIKDILTDTFKHSIEYRANFIETQLNKLNTMFKSEIKDWTFFIPTYNIPLKSSISIGDVEFFILDEEKTSLKKDGFDDKCFDDKRFHDFYIKPNIDMVYAKTTAFGVEKTAYHSALYKIRLAINILKLFIHSYSSQFGLIGETLIPTYRTIFRYDGIDERGASLELVGRRPNFILDKKMMNSMEECGLNELNRILINSEQTDFERRLLMGIYWFGEALSVGVPGKKDQIYSKKENQHENLEYFKLGEGILKLFTALESVLLDDWERNKTENISKRGSKLLTYKKEQYNLYKKSFEHLYWVRGEIVHRGDTFVVEDDLLELTEYVRSILFGIIELNKKNKFKNVDELKNCIENLKLC